MRTISRLHYITQDLEAFTHAELAELACRGGADWVQLRVKNKSYAEWKKIALEVQEVCKEYSAKLIVNDHVQLAKEIGADGVHLGKDDMSPLEARKVLGQKFIIGGTANAMDDIRRLREEGVDYIGLGPFRFTTTKEKLSPVLGLEGIKKIVEAQNFASPRNLSETQDIASLPVIAIGGIQLENVEALMNTGVHGIAVSSAINLAEDKIEMTKKFCHTLYRLTREKNHVISD